MKRFKDFKELENSLENVDKEQQRMIVNLQKLQSGMANKINSISAQATSIISQDDSAQQKEYVRPAEEDFNTENILVEIEKIWESLKKLRQNKVDKDDLDIKLFELKEGMMMDPEEEGGDPALLNVD